MDFSTEASRRALEQEAKRREALWALGREISSTPGWKAMVVAPGILSLEYENWPAGVTALDPMYVETRAQWDAWRKVVEKYTPAPDRIKELEQQLAQAREELRIAMAQRQDKAALLTAAEEYIKDLLPLVGENAAMRALLELAAALTVHASSLEAQRRIRAFLAAHPPT